MALPFLVPINVREEPKKNRTKLDNLTTSEIRKHFGMDHDEANNLNMSLK